MGEGSGGDIGSMTLKTGRPSTRGILCKMNRNKRVTDRLSFVSSPKPNLSLNPYVIMCFSGHGFLHRTYFTFEKNRIAFVKGPTRCGPTDPNL